MNVQRVSNEDFTAYLMKYAMKAECAGHIDIETASPFVKAAHPDLPTSLQHVAAAYTESRVVGPCEAALVLLGKQVVEIAHVRFVHSGPPQQQNMPHYIPAHHSPLDIYMDRPDDMEGLTFTEFHQRVTHKASEWNACTPVLGCSRGKLHALLFDMLAMIGVDCCGHLCDIMKCCRSCFAVS